MSQHTIAIIENNIIATNTIREGLCRALKEKGFNIFVLTSGTNTDIELAKQKGFNVINIGSSTQNPLDILRYMLNIKKALKKIEADVCLTFTIRPAIWGNVVTRWLKKTPTITNITGIGPLFERNNIAYRAARTLYKFVLQKTAKLFFQNQDDMQIFLEKKFAKPQIAECIPGSGVDYTYYTPLPAKNKTEGFQFLFISRLVKDKGIVEYVKASAQIKEKYNHVQCNVIGPIWHQNLKDNTVTQNELNEWVNNGFINYLGEIKDVRQNIANADCIVLPSYREGTSNVLLEASSMAKPSITCNTTGCKEIVEDNVTGFLCNVRDVDSLAAKMNDMLKLSADQRNEKGQRARAKIIEEYDKQIVINAYLNAVNKIINNK
ncbi:MAG: glycosyltransferase family 4 protein [Chitinophagaceae bacterium]|nr:glycosyltransferase family 4 protein [Chitinophagaceae bacterium]